MWNRIVCILILFLPFQFATHLFPGSDVSLFRILILCVFFGYLFSLFWKREGYGLPVGGVLWVISAILVMGIGMAVSNNADWAIRKGFFLINFLLWYSVLSLLFFRGKGDIKDSARAIIISGTLIGGVGIIQWTVQFFFGLETTLFVWREYITPFFLGSVFSEKVLEHSSWLVNVGGVTIFRAIGTFPDPHMFSFFLELCLPWAFFFFLKTKKKRYLISCIILLSAILLSFSRGAYMGLMAGFLVTVMLVFYHQKARFQKGLIIMTLFVSCVGLLFGTENFIRERFADTFLHRDASSEERIILWKQALEVIMESPIWGVGLGGFPERVQPSATYRDPIYAHNLYLDIGTEMGFLGIFLWGVGIVWALGRFFSLGKDRDGIFFSGGVSLIIFSVHGIFDTPLYSIHVLGILCVVVAIAWGVSLQEKMKWYEKRS